MPDFETILDELPIVAIIRGVTPDRVVEVAEVIAEAGIKAIEVPLNSPDAFRSIELLSEALPDLCTGAGTVTSIQDVDRVSNAGGQITVSPNTNPDVIKRAIELGMIPVPGFQTATEAINAIDAGARYLKLFPAGSLGTSHLKAIDTVLPREARVLAVGGVGSTNIAEWRKAGVHGFGIGSEIFRPAMTIDEIRKNAQDAVRAFEACE